VSNQHTRLRRAGRMTPSCTRFEGLLEASEYGAGLLKLERNVLHGINHLI